MHSWAKGLSREVGRHGITVNCLPPGRIMSEQIRRNYTPEYRQWQADNEIPVGRYGEPEDVANLVCFLASPLAGYITGTVIPGRRRLAALPVLSRGIGLASRTRSGMPAVPAQCAGSSTTLSPLAFFTRSMACRQSFLSL